MKAYGNPGKSRNCYGWQEGLAYHQNKSRKKSKRRKIKRHLRKRARRYENYDFIDDSIEYAKLQLEKYKSIWGEIPEDQKIFGNKRKLKADIFRHIHGC